MNDGQTDEIVTDRGCIIIPTANFKGIVDIFSKQPPYPGYHVEHHHKTCNYISAVTMLYQLPHLTSETPEKTAKKLSVVCIFNGIPNGIRVPGYISNNTLTLRTTTTSSCTWVSLIDSQWYLKILLVITSIWTSAFTVKRLFSYWLEVYYEFKYQFRYYIRNPIIFQMGYQWCQTQWKWSS